MEFINEYFIRPIEMREGYNIVNTVVYVVIAILALYLLSRYFNKKNIPFLDERMIFSALPYAITAGMIRAIVDFVDNTKMQEGIYGLYTYSYWNVTPGIYIVMSSIFLFVYYLEHRYSLNKISMIIGYAMLVFHLFLILPHITHISALISLIMAYIPAILLSSTPLQFYAYLGQALDGASTFVAIELIGKYQEKHVVASAIGDNFSYLLFYLLKIGIVYVIDRYYTKVGLKEDDRRMVLGLAAILGLGIGTRNMIRVMMDI